MQSVEGASEDDGQSVGSRKGEGERVLVATQKAGKSASASPVNRAFRDGPAARKDMHPVAVVMARRFQVVRGPAEGSGWGRSARGPHLSSPRGHFWAYVEGRTAWISHCVELKVIVNDADPVKATHRQSERNGVATDQWCL